MCDRTRAQNDFIIRDGDQMTQMRAKFGPIYRRHNYSLRSHGRNHISSPTGAVAQTHTHASAREANNIKLVDLWHTARCTIWRESTIWVKPRLTYAMVPMKIHFVERRSTLSVHYLPSACSECEECASLWWIWFKSCCHTVGAMHRASVAEAHRAHSN